MLDERIPDKIIVYYDMQNEAFLIRLIDADWNDIFKYDTLPAFCKLSDLYVGVIDVKEHSVLKDTVESETVLINRTYVFSRLEDNTVEIHSTATSSDEEITTEKLKYLFGVAV